MSVLEPNYLVLLAPGADANDPDPTWIDVSNDLMSVQIDRGSPSDLDRNNPGTLTFVLDNYSGDYDNENADSPYVGDLVPMTQVLVYAEFDGELYTRFRGFLDTVDLTYPGAGEALATFAATDGFKVLAGTTLPSSVFAAEVLADSPICWFRLGDSSESTTVIDSIGGRVLTLAGTATLGTNGLVDRDANTAMTINSEDDGATGPALDIPTPYPMTLACIWASDTATRGTPVRLIDSGGVNVMHCGVTTSGADNVAYVTGVKTTNFDTVLGTTDLNDGSPHLIVGVWDGTDTLHLYVDGVEEGTPVTPSGTVIQEPATLAIGTGMFAGAAGAVYDEVLIFDTVVPATRIAAWASARATPWDGDTPAERADRICDLVGWPAGLRNFDTGASNLQSASLDMDALEHLQKIAESEFGGLSCALDGTLALRDRDSLINRPPLATFGDADGEVAYRSISFDNSDTLLRNPVTISRNDGVAQTVEDATNVARYYPHQFTLDGLYHDDDSLSRYAAQFFVSEYKDPKRRITGLSFGPAEESKIFDLYPLLLEAELGNVYDVVFRPPNVTLPFEQRVVLEGTSESWTPDGGHTVNWSLSPAYTGTFWELDSADGDGLDFDRLYF